MCVPLYRTCLNLYYIEVSEQKKRMGEPTSHPEILLLSSSTG